VSTFRSSSDPRAKRLYELHRSMIPPSTSTTAKQTTDAKIFGDIDVLQKHIETWQSRELLQPCGRRVCRRSRFCPRLCWDDPQVQHNAVIRHRGRRAIRGPSTQRGNTARAHARRRTPRPWGQQTSRVRCVRTPCLLADMGADIKIEATASQSHLPVWTSREPRQALYHDRSQDARRTRGSVPRYRRCVTSNFGPAFVAPGHRWADVARAPAQPDRARCGL
jgi:hypothetical protein